MPIVTARPASFGVGGLGATVMTRRDPVTATIPSSVTSAEAAPSAKAVAATLASELASPPAQVMAEPAETQAVSQIVTAVTGSRPDSGAVSTLLLSPLLADLVTR